MSSFTRWMLLSVAAAVCGVGLFLVSWDIPVPSERVEVTLPDERFPR